MRYNADRQRSAGVANIYQAFKHKCRTGARVFKSRQRSFICSAQEPIECCGSNFIHVVFRCVSAHGFLQVVVFVCLQHA